MAATEDVTLVDVGRELGSEAAGLVGDLLLRSAHERERIADFLIEGAKCDGRRWMRRALVAEARLDRFKENLLALGALDDLDYASIDAALDAEYPAAEREANTR